MYLTGGSGAVAPEAKREMSGIMRNEWDNEKWVGVLYCSIERRV